MMPLKLAGIQGSFVANMKTYSHLILQIKLPNLGSRKMTICSFKTVSNYYYHIKFKLQIHHDLFRKSSIFTVAVVYQAIRALCSGGRVVSFLAHLRFIPLGNGHQNYRKPRIMLHRFFYTTALSCKAITS